MASTTRLVQAVWLPLFQTVCARRPILLEHAHSSHAMLAFIRVVHLVKHARQTMGSAQLASQMELAQTLRVTLASSREVAAALIAAAWRSLEEAASNVVQAAYAWLCLALPGTTRLELSAGSAAQPVMLHPTSKHLAQTQQIVFAWHAPAFQWHQAPVRLAALMVDAPLWLLAKLVTTSMGRLVSHAALFCSLGASSQIAPFRAQSHQWLAM